MPSKPNPIAEQNLIFAGLGLQLGILSKDKVIRAFTEWLFDKSKPLAEILIQQKALTAEQSKQLIGAVQAHIQQEGDQEKALASLHMVKDLESDLDHLADKDLMGTLDVAITKRKNLGWDLLYSQSHAVDSKDDENFTFDGGTHSGKDRFERRQFLDSGNLGEVYFAKDLELNRLVVAKYIKPERSNESLTRALFHLEGEVTGSLEHPNIVPVYGLGKDTKGRLYYAMRYIRGRKLTRVIAEYHQIPKSESSKKHEALIGLLQYFQSACLAIEYAHSKGVLHCDIKPDNIMIGDYGEVFVVDWGLVVVQGEVKGSSDIQQMETLEPGSIPPYRPSELASSGLHEQQGGSRKSVGGTPAYMAPEQFKATLEEDVTHVTEKADIYALGSTLYHLLTNRAPHLPKGEGKESPDAFFFRITTGMIPKPKEIKFDVPNGLQGIVLKSMEINPEDRYPSARELAEDVKRWVADEPVIAYQENLTERSLRFARNNKALLAAASLALVFTTVVAFGYGIVTQDLNEKLMISEKESKQKTLEALLEKDKAKRSEQLANIEREKAEASEKITIQQKKQADQMLFVNKIQRAYTEWLNGDAQVAGELLSTIPFNQREWEHHYLNRIINLNHVIFAGHSGPVYGVNFSSDGKKIVSCCHNGMIIIWNVMTGEKILSFKASVNSLYSVCFSPDGSRILSAGNEIKAPLKIWDSISGKEILSLGENKAQFRTAIFSYDGTRIFGGSSDGFIRIFDTNNGKEIKIIKWHDRVIDCLALSPDGKKLVSSIDNQIKVWDAFSGQEIANFKQQSGDFHGTVYSFDGGKIASVVGNNLHVCDAIDGKEIGILKGHKDVVYNLNFSPDGKFLASASRDKTIKVWEIATGKEVQSLIGNRMGVGYVAFSPDSKMIVSAGYDKNVRIWNLAVTQNEFAFKKNSNGIWNLTFSSDGQKIIYSEREVIKIWNPKSNKEILTLKGHKNIVRCVSISPDGTSFVSGGDDKTIKVWNAESGKELQTLMGHTSRVTTIKFSPDGKKIASGSEDATVKLWDTSNWQNIFTFNGHSKAVQSTAFSPDGNRIVSGGLDHKIKVWDINNGREIISFEGVMIKINSLSFSPDGCRIIGGGLGEYPLKVWDAKTGKEIINLRENKTEVLSVIISPNGNRIVSASADNFIRIFDNQTGQKLFSYGDFLRAPRCIAFSPDGKMIVTGTESSANSLQVLNAPIGFETFILGGHGNEVRSVALDADGKRIISAGKDQSIKIWDRVSGQIIKTFDEVPWQINNTAFSSDGKRMVIEDLKRVIHAMELDSGREVSISASELAEYKLLLDPNSPKNNEWSVETEYGNVILVNNKLREQRIAWDKERLALWAQPDPKWHSQNAEESEKNKQWFAAAFHLRKLVEIEPNNAVAKKRLQVAEMNLKEGK